jgi:hypothetical protein
LFQQEIRIMNDQSDPSPHPDPTPKPPEVFYNSADRVIRISPDRVEWRTYSTEPIEPRPERARPPSYTFEDDPDKGVCRLRWADGKVEVFRDRTAYYLVVERDETTGAIRPVLTRGQPTRIYLCREEREIT